MKNVRIAGERREAIEMTHVRHGLSAALAIIAVLYCCTGAVAAPVNFGGHAYDVVNAGSALTWDAARLDAQQTSYQGVQGHLVVIASQAEDAFLIQAFDVFNPANPNNFILNGGGFVWGPWIGFNTFTNKWVDGSSLTYNGFFLGEPSGDGPGTVYLYNAVHFSPPRQGWNDENNLFPVSYIVEFDTQQIPEPSTFFLVGIGVGGFGLLRRRTRPRPSSRIPGTSAEIQRGREIQGKFKGDAAHSFPDRNNRHGKPRSREHAGRL